MSKFSLPIKCCLSVSLFSLAGCRLPSVVGHSHGGSSVSGTRQAQVAEDGATVMPFDLVTTTHIFQKLEQGGLQQVIVKDPNDIEQIKLIRTHLAEEAQRFQQGDFHDPAQIHSMNMPGLHELMMGAKQITIQSSELPNGAQILYTTTNPALVTAIHAWFDAQLADHGQDATDHQ
ncbi:hypothetical protein BH10CHL1_BH10CHL1_37230 [soil metagenome]